MAQLHENANYSRICQLLIGKGGNAFRNVLQTKIDKSPPPSTLDSFLKANKKDLNKLRYRDGIINATQWDLLFPRSGTADSQNFDITLLTVLLRNICGLPSPVAGWNAPPHPSDTSTSAEILRVKMSRNEIYGHKACPQLDNAEFEMLWQQISESLLNLGIPQNDIDELKQIPLSEEEESYIEKIKEWKEFEDDVKQEVVHIKKNIIDIKDSVANAEKKVAFVEEKVINISDSLTNVENEVLKLGTANVKSSEIDKLAKFVFKKKIEDLSNKLQGGTRKWFLDGFKHWLNIDESRVMILTAGPGVGKSVLSAKICELHTDSGQLAACHFCDFRTSDYRDPHRILQSLASQMCDNVHGFRDKLTEALSREHARDSLTDAFRVLLHDPLQGLDRTEPMLIVVDALDESKTPIKSELLDLISDQFSQLPKWIKIFISSRPELQVREKLKHLNPVEIRPNDDRNNRDLKQFIEFYFPSLSRNTIGSLVSECQGSFLYAYYLVKEQVDSGTNPNINVHVPKGISGFYEKQFERLKKDLQCYEQITGVSIFKNFINVVAASEEPLPFRFLFACIDLFAEQFKIRKTVVGKMSEILPVYDDCLTVFHKSLWDWLKLDGYEEHAYAADVADGKKRLWRACKKVYTDIHSLSSVSNFQISPEKMYALENGVKYFVNVDCTEDWKWLVNVKVNYFKLFYCLERVQRNLVTRLFEILKEYKSRIPDDFFWHLFQFCTFLRTTYDDAHMPNLYLRYFANKQFSLVHNSTTSNMVAREMLDETKTIWLEEVTTETDSSFKLISNNFLENDSYLSAISASPDNKLLAMSCGKQVKVYELPSLKIIFRLHLNQFSDYSPRCIVFSPDSSYFLLNSLQTCVSIKNQSIIPFIPHGPAEILSSSFSSCGTKLVSAEKQWIKVWDVIKKELVTEMRRDFVLFNPMTCFIGGTSYIFHFDFIREQLNVFDSTTLNILETTRTDPCSTKLDDCTQVISPRFSTCLDQAVSFNIHCWQLITGQKILWTRRHCSMPFVWNGRKCVMTSNCAMALVVYDYVNQQVIDTFQISSLPSSYSINYIANLDENNFLICLQNRLVFVLSLQSSYEFPAFSFISDLPYPLFRPFSYPIFCSLSPDNLYVACSYGSPTLKIMNVDDRKTLQTVSPKEKPIACWWSELYLWVVCEGLVVIKYPYTPTHRNVVGNYVEECSIDCDGYVLKFEEGILVCRQKNEKFSFSKICEENLRQQQILDLNFGNVVDVAISSDGCAVLLYDANDPYFELWEMRNENKWELHSIGKWNRSLWCGCLAGKQTSRNLLWLLQPYHHFHERSSLFSIDFSDTTLKNVVHPVAIDFYDPYVIYVNSKLLICVDMGGIHFIHVPDGTVIASLYVRDIRKSFFVPSKRLLFLFIGNGIIKHFKIHNIDKYLPPK